MLACCQKPDAKAADHGCLENLAHFELRFVKNLGTSPKYAFFVPTSSRSPHPAVPLSIRDKTRPIQARQAKHHPHHKLSANHMIGMNFAFTSYSPHLAASMAFG